MDKVKKIWRAGASLATAVRESLSLTQAEFAKKYGVNEAIVSSVLNGERRPPVAMLAGLVAELGGTEFEWRMLLWEAAKPQPEAEVA